MGIIIEGITIFVRWSGNVKRWYLSKDLKSEWGSVPYGKLWGSAQIEGNSMCQIVEGTACLDWQEIETEVSVTREGKYSQEEMSSKWRYRGKLWQIW